MSKPEGEPCPPPKDPALAAVAAAINGAKHWGQVLDADWRWVYMTDDLRLSSGGMQELAPFPFGSHYFSPEAVSARMESLGRLYTLDGEERALAALGPWMLADTPGGHDEFREVVDPRLRDGVEDLPVASTDMPPAFGFSWFGRHASGRHVKLSNVIAPVRDAHGRIAGYLIIAIPGAGMAVLGTLASAGDPGHFERMQTVAKAARRPAAILFADLESSSPLARRLSTAGYFAFGRRLVRAADDCVVDAGGLVGQHVGDGVVAFFLAENAGSESQAARACISAARTLQAAVAGVAARSGLEPDGITLRFGLHWGSSVYVGQIATSGRSEVAALGDEVNEAARIEACATNGRMLASKALVERLDREDAAALGLEPDNVTYTPLGELDGVSDKAIRDAGGISITAI